VVAAGSKFSLRRGNSGSCSSNNVVINEELSRINYKTASFSQDPSSVSFTTFNILAPIYKRIDPQVCFVLFFCC